MPVNRTKTQIPQNRWSQLTAIGMIAAVVIIGLVVFLTPSADDPVLPAQDSNESATRPMLASKGLALPTGEDPVSAESLQESLALIAETLTRVFANDPAAYHAAAMIYTELRQTEKAKQMWGKCLEIGTLEVGPAVGLAGILAEQGEEERALELLIQIQKASKGSTAEFYQQLSDIYSRTGELEQAEAAAKQGLIPFSQSASLWLQLGLVQSQLRKLDDAELALRKAISFGDDSPTTRNALGSVLNRKGKSEEAKALMASSDVAAPPKSETTTSPGTNDDSGFQDQYRQALRQLSIPLLRNASAVASANGRNDLAENWILMAIAEDPRNPAPYMDLSFLLRSAKRLDDAYIVHQRLVEIQPDNPLNDMNLASVATQLNRLDIAEKVLLQAIQKFPKVSFLFGEMAKLSMSRGQFHEMDRFADKACELEPQNVEWILMQAMAAKQLNNLAEFRNHLNRAQHLAPADPRVLDFLSLQ